MTFEHQIWLVLTPVLALTSVGILALGWRKRTSLLGKFAAPRLLDQLTEQASLQRIILKATFVVAAVALLGLALARPQYGVEWSERKARGLDIVFALDSSKSMLATDLRPTRLERAKLAILDLIDRLESDRIGLVAFAGQAFLQTPPTLDYGAFRESLNATDPSILSRGGSDIGRAIKEAAKAFPTENNVKVVILLTDGEDLGGQAIQAARTAASDGIQVFAIGIGTPEGEYLRIRNEEGIEEFVRDSTGQPVRSQLDEATLREISQLTGGSYTQLSGSLSAFYDSVLSTLPREERESELQEVKIERFQWLLAAALLFLVLEILIRGRRTSTAHAAVAILLFSLATPNDAKADTTEGESLYNEAHAALTNGDYSTANQLYTEAMQHTKSRELQRDALYNMGHGSYQECLAAYNEGDLEGALSQIKKAEGYFNSAGELDPGDTLIADDAARTTKVREAIEQLLEQQQEQEQQEQDESEQSEEQEQQDENQQDEQDQQESGEQDQQQEQNEQNDSQDQEQSGEQEQNQSGQEQKNDSQQDEQSDESQSQDGESPEQQSEQSENGEEGTKEQEEQQASPGEENTEEQSQEEGTAPEPREGEEAESGEEQEGSAGSQQAVQVEGMTIEEAQDLLDSLRGSEEILPFTQPIPGAGRPIKDW